MAINPFRKGGTDTIPIPEGGTGGTTASAALANLGGLDIPTHDALDHSGVPGVGGAVTGSVVDFAGTSVPSGWLECDGTSYTTAGQPALFAAIGYTWGGAGANFNVPNLNRRTTVGRGGSGTGTLANTVGSVGGAETHTLITAELAAHAHGVNDAGHFHPQLGTGSVSVHQTLNSAGAASVQGSNQAANGSAGGVTVTMQAVVTGVTIQNAGSGTAHNNVQPSAVMMKIIKA